MSATPNREKLQFGSGQKRNSKFFLECFDAVRKLTQHWNKWIVDDCWIDIVKSLIDSRLVGATILQALSRLQE
jgi:hypothetical protein